MPEPNKNIEIANTSVQSRQINAEEQSQITALQDEVTRLTCELGECREALLKLQGNKITG